MVSLIEKGSHGRISFWKSDSPPFPKEMEKEWFLVLKFAWCLFPRMSIVLGLGFVPNRLAIGLKSVTPSEIYGGVKGRSTFDVVAVATSMWSHSVYNQDLEPLGQLSLDTSKCFDTFSHAVLLRLASRLGLPSSVCASQEHPGPEIHPVRGLAQGDCLSVLFGR
eukprot:4047728-Amphidinium_carterae.2